MTTLRWQNVPVQQTVQTWVGDAKPFRCCRVCGKQMLFFVAGNGELCMSCQLTPATELAPPLPLVLIQKAQELLDLQDALRDARADRDRYIARRAELERRLEAVRRSADGK